MTSTGNRWGQWAAFTAFMLLLPALVTGQQLRPCQ
jgi:hypothetical protein